MYVCTRVRATAVHMQQSQSNREGIQNTMFSLSLVPFSSSTPVFLSEDSKPFYNSFYSNMFILRTHSTLNLNLCRKTEHTLQKAGLAGPTPITVQMSDSSVALLGPTNDSPTELRKTCTSK